jgi:hypothetical protein
MRKRFFEKNSRNALLVAAKTFGAGVVTQKS